MFWSDDIENPNKKMQPKVGRRAYTNTTSASSQQQAEDFVDSTDDILDNFKEEEIMQAPIAKKAGGWADETLKSAKGKHSTPNLIEQERFQEQKLSIDDDIPVIPDIEEIQDDNFPAEVVQAPSVTINRVSTYRELDKDLLKQNAYSQFGEINLSHLTRFMYLDKDILDPDEVWTKDSLFNELITEYRGSVNEK